MLSVLAGRKGSSGAPVQGIVLETNTTAQEGNKKRKERKRDKPNNF